MLDRKTHWQNIYQEKSPLDVSWYQKEPALSLDLIHRSHVKRNDAIIDVGGGASVLVDYLSYEGYTNLTVLDISANALACAKQRLGANAAKINWIEADITEFSPEDPFSLWHDRAVFHFLIEASDRNKYISVLKRSLLTGGQLIIAAFAIGGPQMCSGLPVVQYNSSKLLAELGESFVLLEEREELHITPANKEQKFSYFRMEKL